MKNVLILGSTGSIGKSTLEVINNNDNFNVISLVAKNQKDLLLEQANKFNASNVYLSNESFSNMEQSKHPNLNFFKDLDALIEDKDAEIVVAAISGLIGVDSILKAIQVGKKILIGEVKLEVIDLCRPCRHLSETLGHENIIKEFLRRGGLRCQILSSSIIKIGDKIKTNLL